MGLEDKVQASGEQPVQRIRQQAEQEIRGFVSELLAQAARERASAIDDNRRVAEEAQLQAVRDEGARVRAEVEKIWAAKLKEANEAAEYRYEEALKAAREDAEHQLAEKVASVRAEGQRVLEAALEAARREADRNLESRVNQVRQDAERTLASELSTAPLTGLVPMEPAGEKVGVVLDRVLQSVRRLDDASSLTEALDALGELGAEEATRTAVLTVQEDQVRGWSFKGFGDSLERDARQVDLSVGEAGLIGRAVVAGASRAIAATETPPDDLRPPFGRLDSDTSSLAVPVTVGGQVMAVLYGDDQGEESHPAWREALEILARHAGHCLEALTAARAVQLAMHDIASFIPEDPGPSLPFDEADDPDGESDHA